MSGKLEKIARRTTEELFTNGVGHKAYRLVLESPDERDLGGWIFEAVRKRILAALREAAKARGKS